MRFAIKLALAGLALGLAAPSAASAASATHGYVTTNVNFRSGPDTSFPSFAVIPYGAPVVILGCLDDRSWCDVAWAGERGWVHAAYLDSQGGGYGYQPAPYADPYPAYDNPVYAAPIISFAIGSYWNDHYRDRSWYRDRARYDNRNWYRDNDRHRDNEWNRSRDDGPNWQGGQGSNNKPQANKPPKGKPKGGDKQAKWSDLPTGTGIIEYDPDQIGRHRDDRCRTSNDRDCGGRR